MLLKPLSLEMLPVQAVMLTADVAILTLPGTADAEQRLLRHRSPPHGTLVLNGPAGIVHLAVARWSPDLADLDCQSHFLENPDHPVMIGSDIALVAQELDQPSRRRLLAFLLGFCRKAFELGDDPDFAGSCLRLCRSCAHVEMDAVVLGMIGNSWTILDVPTNQGEFTSYAISTLRVRRATLVPIPNTPNVIGADGLVPDECLISLQETVVIWRVIKPTGPVVDLLNQCPSAQEGLRRACLQTLAPRSPTLTARMQEQAYLSPMPPVRHDRVDWPIGAALDIALSDGEGNVFVRGWLRDPLGMVESVSLQTTFGDVKLDEMALCSFSRPDVARHYASSPFMARGDRFGFVAHIADPTRGVCAQPSLTFHLKSGSKLLVRPPLLVPDPLAARQAVLSSVPMVNVTEDMMALCLAPAADAFHRRALEAIGAPEVIQIGRQPTNPDLTIIIPLYRTLTFLRFQIEAIATDPTCNQAQIIIALDSPEQRDEVEHLLRGLFAMHELPILFITLPCNSGYATANNIAAKFATGRALLLLNSDVIPASAGWLPPLQSALAGPGVAIVGPKLIFADESVQHAGLYFQRGSDDLWLNAHYAKGMPRHVALAESSRDVPGVTGAALLIDRQVFEDIGGICQDYIIGDYEDSDLCLKARERGHSVNYVSQSELFHFERQSIEMHSGYAGTQASRLNRRLHHNRWGAAIADLMNRPEFQPGLLS